MKEQEVYVKVSVEDELPIDVNVGGGIKSANGTYLCFGEKEDIVDAAIWRQKEFTLPAWDKDGNYYDEVADWVTHWLKPTTGILLTKEELVKLLKESFDYGWGDYNSNFDRFLKRKGLL